MKCRRNIGNLPLIITGSGKLNLSKAFKSHHKPVDYSAIFNSASIHIITKRRAKTFNGHLKRPDGKHKALNK